MKSKFKAYFSLDERSEASILTPRVNLQLVLSNSLRSILLVVTFTKLMSEQVAVFGIFSRPFISRGDVTQCQILTIARKSSKIKDALNKICTNLFKLLGVPSSPLVFGTLASQMPVGYMYTHGNEPSGCQSEA